MRALYDARRESLSARLYRPLRHPEEANAYDSLSGGLLSPLDHFNLTPNVAMSSFLLRAISDLSGHT